MTEYIAHLRALPEVAVLAWATFSGIRRDGRPRHWRIGLSCGAFARQYPMREPRRSNPTDCPMRKPSKHGCPTDFAKDAGTPLPRPGCFGVKVRLLLQRRDLVVAQLGFATGATIDEHAADFEIEVLCEAGEGHVSIGDDVFALCAGQHVRLPAGELHRLWTTVSPMQTLMIELRSPREPS